MTSLDKVEYYPGTTAPKRSSEACVDGIWRLALKDCSKEYHLAVRRMAEQILEDLNCLKIFKKYISLNYIKNLISENEFSLNNFDWDVKDEEIITKRIKELSILVKYLESNKVGDSNVH